MFVGFVVNTELTTKEQKITASMENLMVDNPAPNATVKKVLYMYVLVVTVL